MKAISKRKKMDYISGYTMILPLVLGLGVFYFYPIFKVFYDSFHEVGAFNKTKWVGLENYIQMFHDSCDCAISNYFVFTSGRIFKYED